MANEKIMTLDMLSYYHTKEVARTAAEDAQTLADAKAYTDEQIAALPTSAEYSIVKADTATNGYAASYNLTKDGVATGTTINIPKDYLVKSGSVKKVDTEDTPVTGYKVGDKYIDFVVNTVDDDGNESHLYLLVSDLVDAYTAGVGIEISADNVVSIVAQDGTKEVGGITDEDYAEFKGAVTTANDNKTAIETINNVDTGILANAKTYSDSLNTAMDTRVTALEEATSNQVTTDDIDALFAGT